jgi:hypothetical protein
MNVVTRNEIDTSELFAYAEKNFGLDWNTCCDVFHRSQFLGEGFTDLYLSELEEYLERYKDCECLPNYNKAVEITIACMKEHKVTEMRYIY